MVELFGESWEARETNWSHLQEVTDWLEQLHLDVADGAMAPQAIQYVAKYTDKDLLVGILEQVEDAAVQYEQAVQAVPAEIGLDESLLFGEGRMLTQQTYADLLTRLKSWALAVDRRREIARFNQLADSLCDRNLQDYANVVATWREAGQFIVDVFDRDWYQALHDAAIDTRSTLAMFERESQNLRLDKFRDLDRLEVVHNRSRVAEYHWTNMPQLSAIGQMGELRHEFEKQKRHMPIRRLMERAGNVIQAIKPVFMMSPISIAKYIPPGRLEFDLIVFDEASQIRPANALGAILRGNQVVVTGDSKQLPPTSFFQSIVESDDVDSPTADLESILGLFRAQGVQERTLNWHYRSRHPSLIAVSNYEFTIIGSWFFRVPMIPAKTSVSFSITCQMPTMIAARAGQTRLRLGR